MPNPVLTKFEKDTRRAQVRQAPPPSATDLQQMYDQRSAPTATYPNQAYAQPQQPVPGTGFPPGGGGGFGGFGGGGGGGGGASARPMTIDDVVTRSAAMWGALFVAAAITWFTVGSVAAAFAPVLIVAFVVGLGLGLFISFTGRANPVTCMIYAVAEGVLLGAVSKIFNDQWSGIVLQAIMATLVVSGVTFAVFKITKFRVTPKFTKMVIIGTMSVFALMIINFVVAIFVPDGLGLRSGGALAIVFSLVCIALAISNLVIDFDLIQRAIAQGAPEKTAWYAAFGLMVTIIWLYFEILRLLSYARS